MTVPNVEAFAAILDRHIPDYDDHSVVRDAEATAAAILADLDRAGWLTTPDRMAALRSVSGPRSTAGPAWRRVGLRD